MMNEKEMKNRKSYRRKKVQGRESLWNSFRGKYQKNADLPTKKDEHSILYTPATIYGAFWGHKP